MSLTIGQWRDKAKKLDRETARELAEAFNKIRGWETFRKEFDETGLNIIQGILESRSKGVIK